MDRKHQEKLPAIQLSFIQHLVSPLYHSCAEAGIIPGIMEASSTPGESPVPPITGGGEGFIKTEGEGKGKEERERENGRREKEGEMMKESERKREREKRREEKRRERNRRRLVRNS